MDYEFLIKDLNLNKSQKIIGTDKGLAKIGDGIVNVAYSIAKSIYLTNNNPNNNIIRTGKKVGKNILEAALKNANMKKRRSSPPAVIIISIADILNQKLNPTYQIL